jgi:hypothetical protein
LVGIATPTSAPLLSDDAAALSEPPRPPEQAASENAKPIVAMPISNFCAFTVSTFQLISGRLHRCSADRSALSGCGSVCCPGNRQPVLLVIIEARIVEANLLSLCCHPMASASDDRRQQPRFFIVPAWLCWKEAARTIQIAFQ